MNWMDERGIADAYERGAREDMAKKIARQFDEIEANLANAKAETEREFAEIYKVLDELIKRAEAREAASAPKK